MRAFAFVDVHLGADHDRDVLENRREASVQAPHQEKRVDDRRLYLPQVPANAGDVPWMPQPRRQSEHGHRHSGLANLLADDILVIDAADERLKSRGQMPDEVEHHLFGSAQRIGVRHIADPDAVHC